MGTVKGVLLVLCAAMVLAGCSGKSQEEEYKVAQAEKEQREARERNEEEQVLREEQEAREEKTVPKDAKEKQKIIGNLFPDRGDNHQRHGIGRIQARVPAHAKIGHINGKRTNSG